MQTNFFRSNFFLISFSTSLILIVLGTIFLFLGISPLVTLLALVIFVIGVIQTIVDLGWIAMIKINANLEDWREAYTIVKTQRTQKLFMVPFFVDISFIVISIGIYLVFGIKVLKI